MGEVDRDGSGLCAGGEIVTVTSRTFTFLCRCQRLTLGSFNGTLLAMLRKLFRRVLSLVFQALMIAVVVQVAQAAGPLKRTANTSLTNMPSALPTFGFTYTNALAGMIFTSPVAITSPPGETNRLFIVEKNGAIVVITNLASPNRTLFISLTNKLTAGANMNWLGEEGVLGMAFHPGYATNRYFYVFYTGSTNSSTDRHDILARYQTTAGNPNQGDAASAQILLAQFDQAENHNGGDLHFGPDGYLYFGLGDEGGGDGQFGNDQEITNNFFSALCRIDVDKRSTNLPPNPHPALRGQTNYFIPANNPYVGATNFNGFTVNSKTVRTEFWAVGFRNPWRFSFDTDGTLYCADVGQDNREELDIVTAGGNYGWNFWEGFLQRTNNAQIAAVAPGFTHTPPLLDYSQAGLRAIVGGFVYRGDKYPQLYGSYIYGDHVSGNIWEMKRSGTNVTENSLIMVDDKNGQSYNFSGLSAFGIDPSNNDLLYADVQAGNNGSIKRLIYNNTTNGAPVPTLLSATGAFTNLATLGFSPGIVAYDINTPFWSDNAIKTRFFSVPNTNLTITFNPTGSWTFPTGTVWIKHFELEITNGVPSSRRRIETRFMISNTNGGYGVTYRWTTPPTNAVLVAEAGLDESITNYTSGGSISNVQVWHYPSRVECIQCHSPGSGFALSFNTWQLNRDFTYNSTTTNQLKALSLSGYFSNSVTNQHLLRALAHATNSAVSLEYRVRSYLDANCSYCHQSESARALWDGRITTPGCANNIINGPLMNNLGNTNNRVVVPGSLANSVLFQRVANMGSSHMPPLATALVNTEAVNLLAAWITNELTSYVSYESWQSNYFGSTNAPNGMKLADPDNDGAKNYLEYLTKTSPTNAASAWAININASNSNAIILIPQIANRAFEVQTTTNLFDSNSWSALDILDNAPSYPISNRAATVSEPLKPGSPRYYRARVFEP